MYLSPDSYYDSFPADGGFNAYPINTHIAQLTHAAGGITGIQTMKHCRKAQANCPDTKTGIVCVLFHII